MSHDDFLKILPECLFNWFQVIERISEENPDGDEDHIVNLLDGFYPIAVEYAFDDGDKSLLEPAFKCDLPRQSLVNRALDGLIVTDDDPDQLDITSESIPTISRSTSPRALSQIPEYLRVTQWCTHGAVYGAHIHIRSTVVYVYMWHTHGSPNGVGRA